MCIIRPQPSISAIPVINPDSIRSLSFSPLTTICKYLRLQSIYPIPIVNVSLINFIWLILKQSSKSSSTTIHFHFINFRGRTPLHTLPRKLYISILSVPFNLLVLWQRECRFVRSQTSRPCLFFCQAIRQACWPPPPHPPLPLDNMLWFRRTAEAAIL